METAKIRVNGEERPLAESSTIASYLEALGLDPRAVAVEHNGAIVRRPAYATTPLGDGDTLEIVRFVQGG
ncbi:MAG: sulfur carrier protein ThiS [bacterium]|nr:sulfur carrier protein ThiS [bacterium]